MFHDVVDKGARGYSALLRATVQTTGAPYTQFDESLPGLTLWYRRESGVLTTVSIDGALAAVDSSHDAGHVIHVASGVFRWDLPDAALAEGADYVDVGGSSSLANISHGRITLRDPERTLFRGIIASGLTTATSFSLNGGPDNTSGLVGCLCMVMQGTSVSVRRIIANTGSTITLESPMDFVPTTSDDVYVFADRAPASITVNTGGS